MPKSAIGGPAAIGPFVQNEVKHCVALSGKRAALDFCGIGSGGKPGSDRLFVVATDNQNVSGIVKACNLARVNLEVIEPSVLAYIRAFHAKKIAGRFDCNVLFAIVHGNTLTLCVFKKQNIDFVRTRDIDEKENTSGEFKTWLADEINTVVQFYDSVETSDSSGKWEITVIADSVRLPDDVHESVKAMISAGSVQVKQFENAYQDTPVVRDNARIKDGASAVAIGLAMKLLVPNETNLRLNLLPPEATEVKSFKRHALITANILAGIIFCMIIAIAMLGLKARQLSEEIDQRKKDNNLSELSVVFREDKILDSRIKQLSGEPGRLSEVLDSQRDMDWPALLSDIKKGTPKTVAITSLFNKGHTAIYMEGVGLSYEAIRWFVNTLSESEQIATASLIESEKDDEMGGLIKYTISCVWTGKTGK
jgi:hypothetical protein